MHPTRVIAVLASAALLLGAQPAANAPALSTAGRGAAVPSTADQPPLEVLLAMAGDARQDVRLEAIEALGDVRQYGGPLAAKRAVAVALFAALDDGDRDVRIAALLSLVKTGGWDYDPEHALRIARVSRELAAWAAGRGQDPAIQRSLGLVHLLNGEPDQAALALETSLALEPDGESTRYLLGLARLRQRRTADAGSLFRQVPPLDPFYPNAQEQLKQIP